MGTVLFNVYGCCEVDELGTKPYPDLHPWSPQLLNTQQGCGTQQQTVQVCNMP